MSWSASSDASSHACYREWPGVGGTSNPFLESLTLPLSPKELYQRLREVRRSTPQQRCLPYEQRNVLLSQIQQVYEPLDRDIALSIRLQADMCESYLARTRIDPRYFEKLLVVDRNGPPTFVLDGAGGYFAPTVHMWGPSGAGKTASINRILSVFQQLIRHTQYKGGPFCTTQLTWLKVSCPPDGSAKSLLNNFFSSADAVLGTSYRSAYGARATAGHLLERAAQWSKLHGLAILVIDDMENLSMIQSGGGGHLANLLYGLGTQLGAIVVFVGTYDAARIVGTTLRQLRRGAQLGYSEWDPLDDEDCMQVLRAIWKAQFTAEPTKLTDEIAVAFKKETLALPGLMRDLYRWTQERALKIGLQGGSEIITPDLVSSVALDNAKRLKAPLECLRAGGSSRPVTFPDLPTSQ